MMGPPNVPPNMFQRNLGVGKTPPGVSAFRPFSHLLALKTSLRKNSNMLPWYWFVPDLIVALTIPPL